MAGVAPVDVERVGGGGGGGGGSTVSLMASSACRC